MPAPFSYKNDSDEDNRAAPEEARRRAQALQEQEQQSGYDRDFDDMTSPENYGRDGKSGDTNDVRDQEESGGWANNISSSFGGKKSKGGKLLSAANVRAVLKKRGPLGLIALLGLGGGFVGTALFSPGLILVQMKEALVSKMDTQFSSLETRSNLILKQKIQGATSGICGSKITIKCKYSTISEKQAAKLKAAGVEVEGEQKFGNRIKPTSYSFNGKTMSAQEFASTSSKDINLRNALKKAYNPRFAGWSDKIWEKVSSRIGVTKKRTLPDGSDSEKTKSLNETVKNGTKLDQLSAAAAKDGVTCDDNGCKNSNGEPLTDQQKENYSKLNTDVGAAGDTAAKGAANDVLSDVSRGVGSSLTAATNIIKVTGTADTACQVYSAIRAVGYAAKTVRALQLARYAMVFINTADQIKAGTATPEDVAYLGGILTNVAYDAKSAVKRKAAMDSAGMQYAMYGDTSGFKAKNSSYITQFMAGGGLTGDLIGATDYINSLTGGTPKKTCAVLNNAGVQFLSLAAGVALMLIPGVNVAMSAADIVKGGVAIAAQITLAVLPDMLKAIVAGNVTDGIQGEDAGNAIASGFGTISSQTAQAGGNAPMSVDDAVAYTNMNETAVAMDDKESAATLSPFDASNKYTFMGSIVNKILPFASSTGDVTNPIYTFSSLISSSFSSLIPTSSAASDANTRAAYTSCTDPDYEDFGIATDPFCNPIYGIPPQYINKDPMQVVDDLVSSGQIDETTGEAKAGEHYDNYVKNCIERTEPLGSDQGDQETGSDDGKECKIDATNADYYLYYIDQRADTDMDGVYTTDSGSSDTTTDTTTDDSTDETSGYEYSPDSTQKVAVTPSYTQVFAAQTPTFKKTTVTPKLSSSWYWSVA